MFLYWFFSFLDNDGLPVSSRCKSIWKGKFQTGWCLIPFLELPLTHKMSHKIIQRNHNFSMQHIQSNELGHTYNKFTAMVILMTHLMALMLVTLKCWCRLGLHIGNQYYIGWQYNIENISNRSPVLTVSNSRHQQTVTNTRHQHQNIQILALILSFGCGVTFTQLDDRWKIFVFSCLGIWICAYIMLKILLACHPEPGMLSKSIGDTWLEFQNQLTCR